MTECPKCRFEGEDDKYYVATRNINLSGMAVVDVGFRCPMCKFEFGFEAIK